MNEVEALRWQLEKYRAVLLQQIDRLYNALEELQRTTLFLMDVYAGSDAEIEKWLQKEGFDVDEDGFFQSRPLVSAFRKGDAPEDAVSVSWGKNLKDHPAVRQTIYCHRHIGSHLKHIHDRLGDVGWIYYQDAANVSLQYPFIDQRTAIPFDFDWTTYHTFLSANPENNPMRRIQWTHPTVDYAGEGIILSVSIPVWRNEMFAGLWSIDLPIRYIYRDFSGSKPIPGQTQFIADNQGMLILHEKFQAEIDQTQGRIFQRHLSELGGQWRQFNLNDAIEDETRGRIITDADDRDWVFCHCHVPGVDWTLFAGMPKAAMEEAAAQRLQHAFQQVSQGNFSHRIEASVPSAMSTLVDEFNKMSARLSLAEEHRKEMEQQLLQAQKMEAVGRLAGGVAHDYNNMISVIMGYTELALMKMGENSPVHSHLHKVLNAANRSRELTRQLLAFARRQSIAPKVLDINKTVNSMLKMLKPLIGEDIELIRHPGKGGQAVYIDPSQVDQILANLCVNARDAIIGVGKIIIETDNIELDEAYCALHQGFIPGKYVRLSVSDDGIGMESDLLNHIFEPFFSTKPVGYGTGLGLSTVYGIVKQNNGFINAYSEPDQGTTFNIYLPRVTEGAVEELTQPPDEIIYGNNEFVLVVEDDMDILTLTKKMLEELGYRVLAMHSSVEAVAAVRKISHSVDLLVTDVIMPGLNGRELANQLQAIVPGLKVLFVSGYTSNVIIHRGVLDDDVFLLEKPFSKKELGAKVREVLTSAAKPSDSRQENDSY